MLKITNIWSHFLQLIFKNTTDLRLKQGYLNSCITKYRQIKQYKNPKITIPTYIYTKTVFSILPYINVTQFNFMHCSHNTTLGLLYSMSIMSTCLHPGTDGVLCLFWIHNWLIYDIIKASSIYIGDLNTDNRMIWVQIHSDSVSWK